MKRLILLIERPEDMAAAPIIIARVTIEKKGAMPDVIMHDAAPFIKTNNTGYYCRACYTEALTGS